MSTITQSEQIQFCAGRIDLACLKEGYSFPDEWTFTDETGTDIDISASDFEMVIKDSTGATVATLTLGTVVPDGLELVGTNKLKMLIGSPVTDTAGTYTYELIKSDPGGGTYPWFEGKIGVKAA